MLHVFFDIERVKKNVREATTEDLLDRATVYRAGMEPQALDVIEDELRQRGFTAGEIRAHESERLQEVQMLPDGTARSCSFCHRPASGEGWGWHRMWGRLPVFPRYFYFCSEHQPRVDEPDSMDPELQP